MKRRRFLRHLGLGGTAVACAPALNGLVARMVAGALEADAASSAALWHDGYGPLAPAGPELALPEGFRYRVLGVEGSIMSDGTPTPRAHDGMAAFPLPGGNIRLIRNHEDRNPPELSRRIGLHDLAYDEMGGGGTTPWRSAWGRMERPTWSETSSVWAGRSSTAPAVLRRGAPG
ncbi:MAG TPA: alkaline phosphatase PhoX [Gemmatimonadota bacterium]|nr:alkaline phosphatase PhoX [Gemmatimonadota bacterium]